MNTLTEKNFNQTEIPQALSKTAEDFVEFLKKQIIGIEKVEYSFGISLIRFEIFFEERDRDFSDFLKKSNKRNWQSKINSFFNTEGSTLHQHGNKLIIEVPYENRCSIKDLEQEYRNVPKIQK